jgi:hypothetical protein
MVGFDGLNVTLFIGNNWVVRVGLYLFLLFAFCPHPDPSPLGEGRSPSPKGEGFRMRNQGYLEMKSKQFLKKK